MRLEQFTRSGYQLLHEGAQELARLELAGIRVDVDRLKKTKIELTKKIQTARSDLEKDSIWRAWKKRFGMKASLSSRDQLRWILQNELKVEVRKTTEKGAASADDEVLQGINHDFVRNLAAFYRYDKTLGTFLKGIEREITPDSRIHPMFDLHTARTIRSSSSLPNFQNFPVRNKEISQLIRSLFVASSSKHVLAEEDFKGIEVGVSACYHKDENFISYITTPGKDMHRDMAAQIYRLDPSEVSKDARYGAKNKFVFPQFYGDYYVTCARNLWEWIDKAALKKPDGTPLKDHLISEGIRRLGACDPEQKPAKRTFEHWVMEVQNDFWNNRFRQYGQWRKDFYRQYLDKGYFDILSGFRIRGHYSRNQVTNAPVQGAAFHCLLWSLIQINRKLRKYKMKSRIVGQIHDSLIGDILIKELADYLDICQEVTQVNLQAHFKWLIVPLEIEFEICCPGEPWSEKKEHKFKDGRFGVIQKDRPTIWTKDVMNFFDHMNRKVSEKMHKEPRVGHRSNYSVPDKISKSKI